MKLTMRFTVSAVCAAMLMAIVDSNDSGMNAGNTYFWTKTGLEAIPLVLWPAFALTDDLAPYIDIPFPGDTFTSEHFETWTTEISATSLSELVDMRYISSTPENASVPSVPTLFSDPIFISETPIDYRLQFAADLKDTNIAASAARGRLPNPSGRRLREHYYRYPDQCDATGIALEVFLRLMIYDQIEAFFHPQRIGLWHDLFPDVERRPYDPKELSVARWYGERYAEGYMHTLTNGYVYPLEQQNIDGFMLAAGLNPLNSSMDPSTSTGLGNIVGKRVQEWTMENDLLQRQNDFVDEEGLQRIEDRHPTRVWHHWKPSLAGSDRWQGIRPGVVTQQTFVTPSLGIFSFLYDNETDFVNLGLADVPALDQSEEAYIRRANAFLPIQRALTDEQKAEAEMANNKITSSVFLIMSYVPLLRRLVPDADE